MSNRHSCELVKLVFMDNLNFNKISYLMAFVFKIIHNKIIFVPILGVTVVIS